MLYFKTHQQLLDCFIKHISKQSMHHASIFRVKDDVFLDNFINSLCQLLLNQKIQDYHKSPYIDVAVADNNEIKVAEIKKIIKKCELKPHNNLAKIIVIEELHLLNDSAANALLKTLEEPAKNTFFLMFTSDYSNVLTTIKSRSVVYDIEFSQEDKYNYLKYIFEMSEDAINKSLKIARNDINIITKIKSEPEFWQVRALLMKVLINQLNLNFFLKEFTSNFKDILYWFISIIVDVYNYDVDEGSKNIANYDKLEIIKYLATKFTDDQVYEIYQQALESQRYFTSFKNVDKELVLENLIMKFNNEFSDIASA